MRLSGPDDGLVAELALAVRAEVEADDPGLQRMRAAARGAFAWRTIDDELAMLVLAYDSGLDRELVVRGGPAAGALATRTLVFESGAQPGFPPLALEVELGAVRLVGQLVPAQRATLALHEAGGSTAEITVDDLGCFVTDRPRARLVRLTLVVEAGRLTTGWFET